MLSVAQIGNAVRSTTGQDTDTVPDQDSGSLVGMMTFINRSFWEVANRYGLREEDQTTTRPTVVGTFSYVCPTLMDAIQKLSILDPNTGLYNRLDPMSLQDYRSKESTNIDDYGFPTHYVRFGSNYFLYPTPADVYTIQIDYLQTLDDLLISGTPPIPREWHEQIQYGATWRVFSDVNGDINRAQWYKNLQTNMFNNIVPVQSKEEKDYSNAGVNVKGRTY